MEIIAVPGGHSLGAIVGILFRHVDPARNGVGLADTVGSPALRHGFAERHHTGAGRNAIFGINAAGELVRRGAVGENETRSHGSSATRRQDNRFWLSNPHSPQLPFHRPRAYVEACAPYSTMRPTSASRREDIATGTRRKWGQLRRGESIVAWRIRRFTGVRPPIARKLRPAHAGSVPLSDNLLH